MPTLVSCNNKDMYHTCSGVYVTILNIYHNGSLLYLAYCILDGFSILLSVVGMLSLIAEGYDYLKLYGINKLQWDNKMCVAST